jgi:hypothetical protein
MTTRSILDYAHLIELALRKNSPLPGGYRELKDWAGALDVKPEYRMLPGVLKKFCHTESEPVREGFRRRVVETEGVVATEHSALGTSLVIRRQAPKVPQRVAAALGEVQSNWAIGEEELSSSLEIARVLRQLACGFYYRWAWPGDEPDYEWLDARASWHREVREKLKQSLPGLDSPLLCAQAAERFWLWVKEGRPKPRPEKCWDTAYWEAWREQKRKPPPPVESVWIDDFLAREALAWADKAKKEGNAIIWYEHKALGDKIVELGALPHYGAATDASAAREPVIVCSMPTQGTGKNLQHYSRNLFTSLPPNGATFEQVVGRTHRPGQEADEVIVDWFGHTQATAEALAAIIDDAEYIQTSTGARQKVLYATRLFE